jgi:hypothetical protein
MKKLFFMTFVILNTLSACSIEETYTYWTDKTDNQIQRLEEANINYEIRETEIWVIEKDRDKVVACCS